MKIDNYYIIKLLLSIIKKKNRAAIVMKTPFDKMRGFLCLCNPLAFLLSSGEFMWPAIDMGITLSFQIYLMSIPICPAQFSCAKVIKKRLNKQESNHFSFAFCAID